MKKVVKIVLALLFSVVGFTTFQTEKASAAYSSWQSLPDGSGCAIRIYTDASTYTTSATSIDWFVQNNGHSGCKTLYYTASVRDMNDTWQPAISGYQTGYFSSQTPTKRFYISGLKRTGINASVRVKIYRDSAKTQFKGDFDSSTFYIQKR